MALLGKDIKIERPSGNGEGSELWIVSYADMMTLLLGFFVIMFSLSQIDDRKMSQIGKELAEAFQGKKKALDKNVPSPDELASRDTQALEMLISILDLGETKDQALSQIESTVSSSKDLAAAAQAMQDHLRNLDPSRLKGLNILNQTPQQPTIDIALPDTVLFSSGTANLVPSAKTTLTELARTLTKVVGLAAIEVTGHTDSSPPSTQSLYPNNYALSAARAGAVAQELSLHGIDRKKISVRGLADTEPLFPETGPDGRSILINKQKNRRVQIRLKQNANE